MFAATFLSGAADALTGKEQTILGMVNSRSLSNAASQGAQKVLSVYAQRIYEAIQRDAATEKNAPERKDYIMERLIVAVEEKLYGLPRTGRSQRRSKEIYTKYLTAHNALPYRDCDE